MGKNAGTLGDRTLNNQPHIHLIKWVFIGYIPFSRAPWGVKQLGHPYEWQLHLHALVICQYFRLHPLWKKIKYVLVNTSFYAEYVLEKQRGVKISSILYLKSTIGRCCKTSKSKQGCEIVLHTDYKMLIFALHMFEALAAIFLPAQNPSFMHPCIRFYRSSNPSASFTANHQSCKKLVVKQTPQSWIENILGFPNCGQFSNDVGINLVGRFFLEDSWTSTCASLLEDILYDLP